MLALVIYLVVVGLASGALARWAVPGPDPMSIPATIALGIGGTFLGGMLAWFLLGHWGGFVFSILGAVLLLVLYRKFVQHRPITGPGAQKLPPT